MEAVVIHEKDSIYPIDFGPEEVNRFWKEASKFPTIYGHEIVGDVDKFVKLFFTETLNGLMPNGLFWVMNDWQGVFYLTEIREEEGILTDAHAHYTFFDRRHRGRVPLVKDMLKFWFNKYQFQRLSAEIPNYATPQARHFATECGMAYEGKRRKATKYKNDWFDVNLYGILKSEVLNGTGD